MFSKLAYAMIKKWEIMLCNSVNIYHIFPKLGMSTHVFKMNLRYDKPWEIKLCISVNIYRRLLKLTINTQIFKISLCHHKKWEIKYVSQLISVAHFRNLV